MLETPQLTFPYFCHYLANWRCLWLLGCTGIYTPSQNLLSSSLCLSTCHLFTLIVIWSPFSRLSLTVLWSGRCAGQVNTGASDWESPDPHLGQQTGSGVWYTSTSLGLRLTVSVQPFYVITSLTTLWAPLHLHHSDQQWAEKLCCRQN